MKSLALDNYGVVEMNQAEMQEVDGGAFGWDDVLMGIVIGAAIEVLGDWDNFKAGIRGECKKPKS